MFCLYRPEMAMTQPRRFALQHYSLRVNPFYTGGHASQLPRHLRLFALWWTANDNLSTMRAVSLFNFLSRAAAPRTIRSEAVTFGASHAALACKRSYFLGANVSRLHGARYPSRCSAHSTRQHSNDASARPLTDSERSLGNDTTSTAESEAIAERKAQQPAYEITFTCRKCSTRSSHRISKQAYHYGTTLITCPECKNRHLISDHLKVGRLFKED